MSDAREVCLEIEDDSMAAPGDVSTFRPGDVITVALNAPAKPGDFVLAQRDQDERPLFRRYQPRGRNVVDLVPLNPAYATVRIDGANPGRILGRVVMHSRQF
jgi:SOS-response transcriptional repressor LexA